MTEKSPDKYKTVIRSIRSHFLNYLFIAAAGSVMVVISSAIVKAYLVKAPLDKAIPRMESGETDELLEDFDKSSRWEHLFPALKMRRDAVSVRCYSRRNELGKAMGVADAMTGYSPDAASLSGIIADLKTMREREASTPDKLAFIATQAEAVAVKGLNMLFKRQNATMGMDNWTGYNCLLQELRYASNVEGIKALSSKLNEYHPDAAFTISVRQFLGDLEKGLTPVKPPPEPVVQDATFVAQPVLEPDSDAPFGWATVNRNDTSLFDSSGKFLQKAPSGSLIAIDDTRDSKSGRIATGSLILRNTQVNGIVVLERDVTLRRGYFNGLDSDVKDKLLRRAELSKSLADAEELLRENLLKKNPNYLNYMKVRAEHEILWKEINTLTKVFESSTGMEREKAADKLRLLKPKSVAMGIRIKKAKSDYDDWAESNGSNLDSVSSPEIENLRNQIGHVEEQLQQIGFL